MRVLETIYGCSFRLGGRGRMKNVRRVRQVTRLNDGTLRNARKHQIEWSSQREAVRLKVLRVCKGVHIRSSILLIVTHLLF